MANVSPGGNADMVRPGVMEADKKHDPNMSMHPPSPTPSPNEEYRRMVALSFIHQIGQCRLALKYSMIGWTGTLDQDKIHNALINAHSITQLNGHMDALERSFRPFLPRDPETQELSADNVRRVENIRRKLLEIQPGVKSTKTIVPVLSEIERDAREARLLPPEDQCGWAWSWVYDDWFRWEDGEKKWVSARDRGLKVDNLM